MDLEQGVRRDLMEKLGEAFDCFEEVTLRTVKGDVVRCDVLAIARDPQFRDYPLAFECKRPSQEWHYALWARAIKQAADDVDAHIEDARIIGMPPVAASFLYPAPLNTPSEKPGVENALIRPGFENAIAGMFHLGLMFHVGKAGERRLAGRSEFVITLGPNAVWTSEFGFTINGLQLLREGRPVGSRNKRRRLIK